MPAERSAQLIGMLLGTEVSAGWVDKAVARVNARLRAAGFDDAMIAALAAEDVLAADETPVNVLDKAPVPAAAGDAGEADPEEKDGKDPAGAPHVLIVTTPDGRLRFLQALGSRRKGSVGAGIPAAFTGHLMTDGYTGYQHLLSRIAGIQQCCQHVIRRCRAVQKLGPGGVQNWAGDIIAILGQAHRAVEDARARGSTALDRRVLDDLRERYDTAVRSGIIHNRLRDWNTGNHPGYALACWLRDYKEQVFLFTRDFPWIGRTTSASAEPKPPSATRPSPATGIPLPRSPAGAGSGASWTQPQLTALPHSTPSATRLRAGPGYRHCPPSADSNSRYPVNGHRSETGGWVSVSKTSMSNLSRKCRRDSDIRPAPARSEYRSARAGSPENRTALVTSSDTSNTAVAAVSSLIPRHESRNWRVYLRAQNGEVGNATKASMPAFTGRGSPGHAVCHADPVAGAAGGRASGVIPDHLLSCPGVAVASDALRHR